MDIFLCQDHAVSAPRKGPSAAAAPVARCEREARFQRSSSGSAHARGLGRAAVILRMVLVRVVSAHCRCLLTRARAGSMGLARRDTLQGLSSPFSALAAVNAHENRSPFAPPGAPSAKHASIRSIPLTLLGPALPPAPHPCCALHLALILLPACAPFIVPLPRAGAKSRQM